MNKSLIIFVILIFFSTPAFAQSNGGDMFIQLLPLLLILTVSVFIYKKVEKRKKTRDDKEQLLLDDIETRLKILENKKDSL
jgi:hypothetical protein